MKGLSISAFLLIGLLGGLLIYVCEDIPVFGDPNAPPIKHTELFSVPAHDSEDQLRQGLLPQALISKLLERGFPRPSRVESDPESENGWNVFIPKNEFHYDKEEKYYFIQKKEDQLFVFRDAFVIRWIEKGLKETGVPNMVTYGLADYRSHDTLGETTVIFTAGISVILLLRRRGRL